MAAKIEKLLSYVETESLGTCNPDAIHSVKEALIDIVASTIAGSQTEAGKIVKNFASHQWGRGSSTVFRASEKLKPTGATLVNATMANALDIDDGHRLVKGHPGAVIFPAVLAAAEEYGVTGEEFLTSLLIGYEVGIRAGILAHELRPEYHCTGSWGALGAAAGVSRIIGLSASSLEHALGIAEYHSTYSPMMRCIDHPSMVKDGIGWGSMTGISSAYLAKDGFTGIPSLFSSELAEELTNELGRYYRIQHLYFKPHSCCRWAQSAIEAIRYITEQHSISYTSVEKIVIHTFSESARLSHRYPRNTEEAQYNLSFPAAAYLVFGEVGPKQVLEEIENKEILNIMDKIETLINPQFDGKFPEKALSQIEIYTSYGGHYLSPVMQARGDFDYPLTKAEKRDKFIWLTKPIVGKRKSEELLELLDCIEELNDIRELTAMLSSD
ncbi:MmgE/PrpD family protein [Effusibacillus consociatus]|uniref:MmgE/PrpD family protein n=1 Tax=Effusibacillus consociatus TaxID=1117041 RepID=A0ABV9PX72_9BACL